MIFFTLLTPITYWILIILWSFILLFYIKRLRDESLKGHLISVLLLILAIDAFRTLFESVYFGAWYTALAGFLPKSIHTFLVRPEMVFIPKILNVIAAGIVIILLLFRWLPREEQEKGKLRQLIQKKTAQLTKLNEKLQGSEKRFKIAMEATKDGLWDWDIQTDEVYFSPGYSAMLGYDSSKVPSHVNSWKDIIHPEDREKVLKVNMDCIENRCEHFKVEYRMQTKNGQWCWILGQGKAAERDKGGKAVRLVGTHTDITDRKQAEMELIKKTEELHHSNQLLSRNINILNQAQKIAHIGHFDYDVVKEKLNWSSEVYRIFNKDEKTFTPTFDGYFSLVHHGDAGFARQEYTKSIINKTSFDFEVRTTLDDGAVKYIQNKGINEYDQAGKHTKTVRMILDVTDRKNAENAIKKSKFRHSKMLANIGDVIVIIDQKGINKYKSANIEKLFGWKPEDVIGLSTWTNIHPDDIEPTQIFFNKLVKEPGAVGKTECRYRCKDGNYKWIEFTGVNLFDDPDISGILGNYHDITERKLTEQSLRESETRFKALHNASFGGIVIHDKGVILECNEGLSEMTGYSESELIGMDGLLLISEESRQSVMDNIIAGYELPYEAIGLRKNGDKFPMQLEARSVPYKGKSVRTVEFRDITDQKLAEAEREQLQIKLVQAQKMEAVGRLAGGVAHDFNNMLSIILGNSEIVLEDIERGNPLIQNINEIQKAGQRSSDLTRQLLAFARKQTISPRILDLNVTIEGMLKMLRRLIGEDINLSWRPKIGLWHTRIDPSQVDQILANLCINARDAIQNVGKLTIETDNIHLDDQYYQQNVDFKPGDYVVLLVSDNGCGMDEETVDNLFEPFFTTKDVGEGTGLGMATVYGIVRQNNGFINVHSELGKGAIFKIYLPKETQKHDNGVQKISEKKNLKGDETILLVEDEKAILNTTKMMLERLGYTVLAALSPDEALEIAQKSIHDGIHLLLTDVVMPKMNGRDLSKELTKLIPNLKCLFMSGYTANIVAHHGVLDEGLNFINKPYSKQELSLKLREILDESSI